jgi:hypothetical protein
MKNHFSTVSESPKHLPSDLNLSYCKKDKYYGSEDVYQEFSSSNKI